MIKARFIIEAQVGAPKGADEKKLSRKLELELKKHLEEVKQIDGVKVYDEHWEDTENVEGLLSALVDVGIETKSFEHFFTVLLRAAPTAVVMEEPTKLEIKLNEVQNVANDLIQLFHILARANATMMIESAKLAHKADDNTVHVEFDQA